MLRLIRKFACRTSRYFFAAKHYIRMPTTGPRSNPSLQGALQKTTVLLGTLLRKIESAFSASDFAKSVNVLDTVNWMDFAWQQVRSETIWKCFLKAGVKAKENEETAGEIAEEDVSEEVASEDQATDESEVQSLLQRSAHPDVAANDYVAVDQTLTTEEIGLDIRYIV